MSILISILIWLVEKIGERLLIPIGKWIRNKYRAWRAKHRKAASTEGADDGAQK